MGRTYYVNSCHTKKIQVLLFGTFWNFFFPNIFYLQLVESKEADPRGVKGQLYYYVTIFSPLNHKCKRNEMMKKTPQKKPACYFSNIYYISTFKTWKKYLFFNLPKNYFIWSKISLGFIIPFNTIRKPNVLKGFGSIAKNQHIIP